MNEEKNLKMDNAINKVVTDVALGQLDSLIEKVLKADEALIKASQSANTFSKTMGNPPKTSDALNKQLQESQKLIQQLQADYKKQETALANLQKKYESLAQTKKTVNATDRQTIIDNREIRKELDGQAIANSNLTSYIQKLSVERAKASRIVADYNAQIAMGTALTEEQSAELAQATASFQKYDNAIKAGKKSIGDAREYVGQYERANLGLTNSVNQIVRELPSATYGIQTFFLAISNNIPPFVDEVGRASKINDELRKSGEATVPVWKQVSSAFFSFNGIMSAGLLILALWGKEIGQATKELFNFSDGLDEVNKRQEEFNKTRLEGKKDAQTDIIELRKYLAVVKDRSVADELRQVALKKLREEYPYYFKNLTDEQILLGQSSKAVNQLIIDLEKRKEVEKATDLNTKNRQRLVQLEEEIDKQNDLLKIAIQKTKDAQSLSLAERSRGDLLNAALDNEAKQRTKLNTLIDERILIEQNTIKNEEVIFNLKKETIALEYQETEATEQNTRAIKLNTKAREDYLASEYELWRLRKQNESDRNKEIMKDEASGYELRLMASEQYYENELDLANRAAQEELRVLAFTTDERIKTVNAEYQNRIKELDKYIKTEGANLKLANDERLKAIELLNYNITGINEDASRKQQIIEENKTRRIYDLNIEMIDKLKKEWDTINFGKAKIEIDQRSLDQIDKYVEKLKGLDIGLNPEVVKSSLEGIGQEFAKANAEIAVSEATLSLNIQEQERARLLSRINALNKIRKLTDEQKAEQQKNNEALIKLDDDIIKSKQNVGNAVKSLSELEIQQALYVQQKKKEINEETKRLQYELYSSLKDLAGQLFENQISYYDREIEQSNKHYDALLENAEKGSEQEQLLQEEKAKREEDLQKRKVELQRKQAIFNKLIQVAEIVAETAKAVAKIQLEAAILKANPLTALLAANALAQIPFVLGTSAIQIATVMATPLPQYKDGRGKGKDEFAIVGDGGRSEVIERGSGKLEVTPNVPTITHLGKDDIVHKSLEDFERSKLAIQNASIMASFGSQSRQLEMFDYYLGKELRGISSKIEKGIEKGFKKAKIQNYIKIPPIDIGHYDYKKRGLT